MRGKCGVYALRDFHEMLPSKSLVFLMTVSALGKRNQHSTTIIRLMPYGRSRRLCCYAARRNRKQDSGFKWKRQIFLFV